MYCQRDGGRRSPAKILGDARKPAKRERAAFTRTTSGAELGWGGDRHEQDARKLAAAVCSASALSAVGASQPGRARRWPAPSSIDAAARAVRGPGVAHSGEQRPTFEPLIGHDFSRVRIHDDRRAHAAARGINALAYTLGDHIAFGRGQRRAGGDRLLAHEPTHVAQQSRMFTPVIQRQEDDDAEQQSGNEEQGLQFTARDLLVYPLVVDLWNDIFRHRLSDDVLDQVRLRGFEESSLYNTVIALPFAGVAVGDRPDVSFGDFLEAWVEHAEELQRLAGGSDYILDLISTIAGISIEKYLGSDQFLGRLKAHASSVATVLAVAQGVVSTASAVSESDTAVGEFDPSQWERQTALVRGLLDLVLKDMFKAPDFFNVGPLQLSTHPLFSAGTAAGGEPPSGLTFEHAEGVGEEQGGMRLRTGLTLNLREFVDVLRDESAEESELAAYRGWQGSLWFNHEQLDPTRLQLEMGRIPESSFRVGTIVGGGGFLGLLEGGARYGGGAEEGRELTSWFVNGGFGYSGRRNEVLRRIGFIATYTDWEDRDVLAPEPVAGRTGGSAARLQPFARLHFDVNEDHRFQVATTLGFVTGTHENFALSDFRGDFSYIYQGDRSDDQLPEFRLDLSASVSRLDWWSPDSPLLTGLQARAQLDRYFAGARVDFRSGDIGDERIERLGSDANEKTRAHVPTSVLFTAGIRFGQGGEASDY